MKTTARHVLGLCVLGILGCATVGCSVEENDETLVDGAGKENAVAPTEALVGQGLTLVKYDANWGMTAVFKDEARSILIERRVGVRRTDEMREANPRLAEFEDDVLVTNADGRVILLQQGGDALVDPTWKDRFDADTAAPPVDIAERKLELALLDRATTELLDGARKLDATSLESLESMRVVARRPLETFRKANSSEPIAYAPGYNSLEIHAQKIYYVTANVYGEHSAIWANINGAHYVTCNHGDCGSSSSMPYKCTTWVRSSSWSIQTCGTSYRWSSIGNHNCHDDTVLSLWSFKYGPQGTGVCNNVNYHIRSPSCTTSSW